MNVEAAWRLRNLSETVLEEKAYAKINLSLDILSRREDGYHDLRMVMQSVTLCDTLEMSRADGILFSCGQSGVACRAGKYSLSCGRIILPGGGCSGGENPPEEREFLPRRGWEAAAQMLPRPLRGMNRLYGTDLPEKELRRLGQFVGADVPFCVRNGLCLAEGDRRTSNPVGKASRLPDPDL